MRAIVDYIFRTLFILIGALDIKWAVEYFIAERYFVFGIFVMLAVYMSAYLFKAAFYDLLKQRRIKNE